MGDNDSTKLQEGARRTDAPLHALMSCSLDELRAIRAELVRTRTAWDRIGAALDRGAAILGRVAVGCSVVVVGLLLGGLLALAGVVAMFWR